MIRRHSVRAIILSVPENRVLLIRYRFPGRDEDMWLTPGGGIEAEESQEDALVREIFEETGVRIDEWQGPMWKRRHAFEYLGETYDQAEQFYLVRVPEFEPTHHQNPAEFEQDSFRGFRWWSLADIVASTERFVPSKIGRHLELVIENGPPASLIDVGA